MNSADISSFASLTELGAQGIARARADRGLGPRRFALLTIFACLALLTLLPSLAAAARPERLIQFPGDGAAGSGAGRLRRPVAIAASPVNADIYVLDQLNGRVNEFTAWGAFVRAFGWGVVASGPDNKPKNEIQEITVDATGGTFALRYLFNSSSGGQNYDTPPIPYNASAAQVQAAIEAVHDSGGGSVPLQATVSGPLGGPWTVEFNGVSADLDIRELSPIESKLTGGAATVAVASTQKGANYEICTPASGDVCQAGQPGSGVGQIGEFPGRGIVIDPDNGDVYVTDLGSVHRVQKFDSDGHFLLMFGGEVNKTTGADVCTQADIEGGDVCGAGVAGSGDSEFAQGIDGCLALSPGGGTVYVCDRNRIQEFSPDGAFKGEITFKSLHEALSDFPEAGSAFSLAVDPLSTDLYLTTDSPSSKYVYRIDPATGGILGTPLASPSLYTAGALATDSVGDVFVVDRVLRRIVKFDPFGTTLIPDQAEEEERKKLLQEEIEETGVPGDHLFEGFAEPPKATLQEGAFELGAIATSAACKAESDDLYVAYARQNPPALAYVIAYGPVPQDTLKCPPPPAQVPKIDAQYATAVGPDSATLQAQINPGYDRATTYRVQYGVSACSTGACTSERPLPPGSILTSTIANAALKTKAVFLTGLAPGTTYHYRFVAENSAGAVRGVGGEVGNDGEEGSFTTFPAAASPKQDCPNQSFRSGPSARLTDCRAYELVSPARRTPTGDILAGLSGNGFPAELSQSAADGERLAYSSRLAFGDSLGAPFVSEYIATRQTGIGWSSHAISPPRESESINTNALFKFDIEERAFTADLCIGWLAHNSDPPLSSNAIGGFPNLYKRDNCGPGADTYEAATSVKPPSTEPRSYYPELQGFSTDGSRTVFRAQGRLTTEAPELPAFTSVLDVLLYEQSEGVIRYVCVLPNGEPLTKPCSAGTENVRGCCEGRTNSVLGAVSDDARRIYWSPSVGSRILYLRENADQDQSAIASKKCTEPEKGCTYKVSSQEARFWMAASDGSAALYTEGGTLRQYNAETRNSKTVAAEGVVGVTAGSADLSVFYFVSNKSLHGEGQDGKPNLYRDEEGTLSLVATLSASDLGGPEEFPLSPVAAFPPATGVRSTRDGQHLLFTSNARLSGYDNSDAQTGQAAAEVYLYDAGAPGPVCISCNPTGARPAGRSLQGSGGASRVAAFIPGSVTQLHFPRVITEDGNRIFFNSFDALVPRDVNGKQDVYEWERASGPEGCEELGADLYVEGSGGCLSLISSGEGEQDSSFLDMSIANDARDVFFRTGSSLVHEDLGLIDIYDARQGGGFSEEPPSPAICEGEACQGLAEAPDDPTPASAAFEGAGNVKGPIARVCRKGKTHRKGRCVKKHRKPDQRRAKQNRRAAK